MKNFLSSRLFYILYLIGISLVIVFAFNSYKAYRYHQIYTQYERWPDGCRKFNEKTGFDMSPSFSGIVNHPQKFELKTHRIGYRIPSYTSAESFQKGGILFTGCSFTFGDEVNAEDSYPEQTGKISMMPVYNFGVCGYSLANVIRQLQDLSEKGTLDTLKPSYLVLGTGDWLIDRSLSPFYPTSHLQLAYPYIRKNNGAIEIADPSDFYSIKHLFKLKETYEEKKEDKSFTFSRFAAMSQLVPRVIWANYKSRTWKSDSISSSELYDFVFTELEKIRKKHGIQSIVVLWMTTEETDAIDEELVEASLKHESIHLIDGKKALEKWKVKPEFYNQGHPKKEAHEAYAKEIFDDIASHMITQGVPFTPIYQR